MPNADGVKHKTIPIHRREWYRILRRHFLMSNACQSNQ